MLGSNPQSKGGPNSSQYDFKVAVIKFLFRPVHHLVLISQLPQGQVGMSQLQEDQYQIEA